jgi:cytochrome P450
MIRERRKLGVAGSHDLLSRFMASSGDARHDVDDKYLRDIVVSFLLARRSTRRSSASPTRWRPPWPATTTRRSPPP